ncbi:putative cobalt-precorrin-6A synthase (deacetylating) [uncultured delta proteobacterium]|uniref:Cobalt-precorrin-5B C(1)-methyltransferase n=1 Tax=uncultured delta proteobacterium TaxID=34034 RepID=A0A212J9H8_9DELT|nr:putative cobalt-precorrin-6A synthase (deacetylating) [uncultured delta proteobacterium]
MRISIAGYREGRMSATKDKPPREGFTTGSAVSAAAAAALAVLLSDERPSHLSIPLPPDENGAVPEGRLAIPLDFCERIAENGATLGYAGVIKDAGDDPDVTDGMLLTVHAALDAAHFPPHLLKEGCVPLPLGSGITLHAGPGIGRATLPGLPVAVGEMAVNPAPRRQIAAALKETASRLGYDGPIHCRLAALGGESRAQRTLNPRLGVLGGISILGTRGTVKPFSADAWKTTIRRSLDLAAALGCDTVCLTTGRRSEAAMRMLFGELADQAFIQVADHAGFALGEAAARGFSRILWGCFPGKLLKLAQGLAWTHAHDASPDFALFSRFCAEAGLPHPVCTEAARMPTVTGALETVFAFSPDAYCEVIRIIGKNALGAMRAMAAQKGSVTDIRLYVFDMQGNLLATVKD